MGPNIAQASVLPNKQPVFYPINMGDIPRE